MAVTNSDGLSLVQAKDLARRATEHYGEPCLVYRDKRRWQRKTYGVVRESRAHDWQKEHRWVSPVAS